MTIHYRKLTDIGDLRKVSVLEAEVWGMNPIPLHQTLTAVKNGGVMIGAEDEGNLIGFVYGFPGVKNGQIYLCSHMMGVDKRYRNRGIGYDLKMKQAALAREMGYQQIRWTYDPLESRNAYLNLGKLGAYTCEYMVDCYGGMDDALNQGLPTDRLSVTWEIEQRQGVPRPTVSEGPKDLTEIVLDVEVPELGWPRVVHVRRLEEVEFDCDHLFIPIPNSFQVLKREDLELAREWRMATRQAFLNAFAEGWAAVDVIQSENESIRLYVLQRGLAAASKDTEDEQGA